MLERLRLPLILFFATAMLGMGLLSPLVDDVEMTTSQDMALHVRLTARAFHALESGQWPPRADIWVNDHEGLGYPVFQFYAPLAHVGGALIMKAAHFNDPYRALKLVMLAAFVAGGVFLFRVCRLLGFGEGEALLAAMLFLACPYSVLNIHVRGAITEFIGQCMIPGALYASLRCAEGLSPGRLTAGMAAWLALLLSHTITFLCFVPLLGLFLVVEGALAGRSWRRLPRVAAPLLLACLAGAWILGPVATYPVAIKTQLGAPTAGTLTTLWTLLAPAPVAPFPLPNIRLDLEGLRPAIGLPAQMALLLALAGLLSRDSWRHHREAAAAAAAALAVFALAFLVAWMPAGRFWSYVPGLAILQFSYRMLSQVAWASGLLAAAGLFLFLRRGADLRAGLLGGFVCVLAVTGYLESPEPGSTLRTVIEEIFDNKDYLVQPAALGAPAAAARAFRPVECRVGGGTGGWRCPVAAAPDEQALILPIQYYPGLMTVAAGGAALHPVGVAYNGRVLTGLIVPPGGLPGGAGEVEVRFTGSAPANLISVATFSGLGALWLGLAVPALRRRERGRAAASALLGLLLIAPAAASVSPRVQHSLRGDSTPELRRLPGHDWEFRAVLDATPAPTQSEREPLLTLAHAMEKLVVFLEPAGPGQFRAGFAHGRKPKLLGSPFPAAADGRPLRLEIVLSSSNLRPGTVRATITADGVPVLEGDLASLSVRTLESRTVGSRPPSTTDGGVETFGGALTPVRFDLKELSPPLPWYPAP